MRYALLYRGGRPPVRICSNCWAAPFSPPISCCSSIPSRVFLFCMLFFSVLQKGPPRASLASSSKLQLRAFNHPLRVTEFFLARRVSSLTACFVNTPSQRNLIPSFINVRITFSPSWLMLEMCCISTTSSRPRRSVLAFSHALFSSVAQGATSFPSTTSRRCLALSISEIFSIASPTRSKARRRPNPTRGNSFNFQERTRNTEVEGVERVKTVELQTRALVLRGG